MRRSYYYHHQSLNSIGGVIEALRLRNMLKYSQIVRATAKVQIQVWLRYLFIQPPGHLASLLEFHLFPTFDLFIFLMVLHWLISFMIMWSIRSIPNFKGNSHKVSSLSTVFAIPLVLAMFLENSKQNKIMFSAWSLQDKPHTESDNITSTWWVTKSTSYMSCVFLFLYSSLIAFFWYQENIFWCDIWIF